ncbi:MAG: hypothetical protein KYX68_11420, partial [Flavobacterium sp.]|nr:hypothetical protein [Flavobacterium sp.]
MRNIFLKENKWIVIILLLAFVLRVFNLGFQSAWLDEIHTLIESNPKWSFFEVYNEVLKGEQIPPHYFYIVFFFFNSFGKTILVARSISVIG